MERPNTHRSGMGYRRGIVRKRTRGVSDASAQKQHDGEKEVDGEMTAEGQQNTRRRTPIGP